MRLRSLFVTAALAASGLVPLVGMGPAYAAETCDGLPATLVGTPGSTVTGTPGPDVIVSSGAKRVEAGAGDDVICTTGTAPSSSSDPNAFFGVTVLAGPGNDVVDRRGDTDPAAVGLVSGDAGQDVIYGAPGEDFVNTSDGEHDVVATGAGNDSVTDCCGGDDDAPEPDTVDLGPGDDQYDGSEPRSPALSVTGGDGEDLLDLGLDQNGSYTVDTVEGEVSGPGHQRFAISGIEDFDIFRLGKHHPHVTFRGSGADEKVTAGRELRHASLGGGDDTLTYAADSSFRPARVSWNGGPGTDTISYRAYTKANLVTIDLRGRFSEPRGLHGKLRHFENASGYAGHLYLVGTSGANDLQSWSCQAGRVDGGAGDDHISVTPLPSHFGCGAKHAALTAYGQGGNDVLVGDNGRDLLDGGPGHDTADGRDGHDRCPGVEVRTSCAGP